MSEPVTIGLVGLSGYGSFYLNAVLEAKDKSGFRVVGAVDPYASKCKRLAELKAAGVGIYDTLEQFYAGHSAELMTIATPIHLHCPLTREALAAGSNVLCEKPLGAAIQEAGAMIEAREAAGRFVGIGYQWSWSPAIQKLKADVLAGRFGAPRRLRTLVLWPRDETYYARSNWAGALKSPGGQWTLDSPVNNATAHYLHNMFYVLGEAVDRSVRPARVTAELYRANDITNYDTGCCRCVTDQGVELLYLASHAIERLRGPDLVYEFERGTVTYGGRGATLTATFADGSEVDYGDPFADSQNKLWHCAAACRGKGDILCGPEAASSQTLCVNGMQESMPNVVRMPAERIQAVADQKGRKVTYVEGLYEALERCYDEGALPSELGMDWACAGEEIDLKDYAEFPSERYLSKTGA